VRESLAGRGWPVPIFADSGNGAHLVYGIDLPNDDACRELVKRALTVLATLFSGPAIVVDRINFNAGRIWKLYGTPSCKGDSLPDRPHRLSRILEAPETPAVVSREQLEELAARAPESQRPHFAANKKLGAGSFNLDDFIARHNISVKRIEAYQGGRRLILDACVFDANHSGTTAAIIEGPEGALGYSCLHNGCTDKHWADLRELFEPEYKHARERFSAKAARNPDPETATGASRRPSIALEPGILPQLVDAAALLLCESGESGELTSSRSKAGDATLIEASRAMLACSGAPSGRPR
jgi:hypothetical protein